MAINDGLDVIPEEEERSEDKEDSLFYDELNEHEDDGDDDDHTSLAWHLDKFPDPSVSISLPTRSFSPSSQRSSFTASPEWRESGSSHLKSVLSALIEDVEVLSEGLDEIQADIRSLRLTKYLRSPETTSPSEPPKLVFTPATPDLEGDQPELEDWEIEARLKGMLADVEMMYIDLTEMAEGYFPDDGTTSLVSENQVRDTSSSEGSDEATLEPEDVMQMLTELRIPEMLGMDSSDDESLHDAHSVSIYSSETQQQGPAEETETATDPTEEDLFADEEPQSSASWSSRFGSAPSLSVPLTPSDSGKEGYLQDRKAPSYANESLPELSIVDETFLRNFEAAVSPLSRFIRSHSPTPKTTIVRSIKHSSTVLFSAPPKLKSSTLRSMKSGSSPLTPTAPHLGPLFSEPKPLLPFSIHLTPRSTDTTEESPKQSLWSKLKLMKRNRAAVSVVGPRGGGSPFKLFNSPLKRSTMDSASQSSPPGLVYDVNSVRGNPGCLPSRPY